MCTNLGSAVHPILVTSGDLTSPNLHTTQNSFSCQALQAAGRWLQILGFPGPFTELLQTWCWWQLVSVHHMASPMYLRSSRVNNHQRLLCISYQAAMGSHKQWLTLAHMEASPKGPQN